MSILKLLGVETEEEAIEVIRGLVVPTVVITLIQNRNGVSISGVGNSSYGDVKSILMEALKIVTAQEIRSEMEIKGS